MKPGKVTRSQFQYAHKLAAMVGENLHKDPSSMLENLLFYL